MAEKRRDPTPGPGIPASTGWLRPGDREAVREAGGEKWGGEGSEEDKRRWGVQFREESLAQVKAEKDGDAAEGFGDLVALVTLSEGRPLVRTSAGQRREEGWEDGMLAPGARGQRENKGAGPQPRWKG